MDAAPSAQHGLTDAQARQRLARFGPNRVDAAPPRRRLHELARRLGNPLVLVLLSAAALSWATGEGASAWIIVAVVLLSLALDHVQQSRAEDAAARLQAQVALAARVVRGGVERRVPASAVVPGDLVRVAAGALVPADGVLVASSHLYVQESAVTGESYPVEKPAGAALFMGTGVVSGTGEMLVERTGGATRIGAVAEIVRHDRGELAFENDLRRFGLFIVRVTVALVLFVVLASGLAHRPWLESFLFAVALAVGITPELLPMVVTVSLTRGALRLAARQVIVKRLGAIHNLGSMDVLCTDKTGTLTEARIRLVRHVGIDGTGSACVLENAWLNSRFETGLRGPLEEAILECGAVDAARWRKVDEVPFDFERRRVSVLLDDARERRLCVKGAPADVLRHCDRYDAAGVALAWDAASRAQAQATLRALEGEGLRVLGVAWKPVDRALEDATLEDEEQLVFAGFAAFLDPPKADAAASLAALARQGVKVKVVTGDSDLVTRHVCASLGVEVHGVLLGDEVAAMDDRALAHRVRHANLFCRVDPIQKNRIIRALRHSHRVVGFLGDGINDAPALHSADVGISVDTAADTARAAADLILTRHDLGVLADAVTEGRRTFANTRKYILLGTSSNFGNMASMAAAAVFLPFLPMLPVQILLNNLLYDALSAALPLDRVEAAETARPQAWDMGLLRRFMLAIGPVSSVFDLLTFALLLHVLGASEAQFQSGWFIESLATQVLAVFVIRTRGPAFASRPAPALAAAAGGVLALAAALPYTPLGPFFGLVALPAAFYAGLAAMTALYLVLLEAAKRRFFRHAPKS